MDERDAIDLLSGSGIEQAGPSAWADLGCGTGTFTRALAARLADGSTIEAMDRDAEALRALPATHHGVTIRAHVGDFTRWPWPFATPDGILLANALHYVPDPLAWLRACASSRPAGPPRFLIVEYDTDRASRWVPFPIDRTRLSALFNAAGYRSIRILGERPSVFRRAVIYAAAMAP
jgi:ubiquinone/menaquinone biosynthesis C-methylase UbiE